MSRGGVLSESGKRAWTSQRYLLLSGALIGSGSDTITDPIYGNCHVVGGVASGGVNQTNAVATVYAIGNCTLFGVDAMSGDTVPNVMFGSVVFRETP